MKNVCCFLFVLFFVSGISIAQKIKCEGPDCKAPLCKDMEGIEYSEHSDGMTDKDKKKRKKSGYSKNFYQGEPFTGTIYKCPQYLGGRIISVHSWKDGERDGFSKTWYDNGRLERISFFKGGKTEGTGLSYYENGYLKSSDYYVDGLREGFLIKYDDQGNMIEKIEYSKGKKVTP